MNYVLIEEELDHLKDYIDKRKEYLSDEFEILEEDLEEDETITQQDYLFLLAEIRRIREFIRHILSSYDHIIKFMRLLFTHSVWLKNRNVIDDIQSLHNNIYLYCANIRIRPFRGHALPNIMNFIGEDIRPFYNIVEMLRINHTPAAHVMSLFIGQVKKIPPD